MKNFFLIISLVALTFAGCSSNSSTENTHDHENGTSHTHENSEVHQHHDTIKQEEFTVGKDSITHGHEHTGDSTHSHSH